VTDTARREVLITGASRGIGRAIALRFAEEGARIFASFFVNIEAAEDTAREIEKRGGVAHLLQGDLKDPAQVSRMVDDVRGATDRLDVLVHGAASGVLRDGLDLEAKHWDWVLSTNARPLLLLVKRAATLMREGGRVIALSSLGSQRVIPRYAAIGVSKAALEALVRYLAVELAPRGIAVNAVSAGAVATDVWRAFPDGDRMLDAIRERTPSGRLVTPDEVADVVHFLASPAAAAIHGHVMVVDGGYSLLA
jgi:enoyl-[acyl-carrier protein] reductase III